MSTRDVSLVDLENAVLAALSIHAQLVASGQVGGDSITFNAMGAMLSTTNTCVRELIYVRSARTAAELKKST